MLWESMEVTEDLKSFLAAVPLPEREADGCESQKCHDGREMSRSYTSFLNKFVKQGWLVERQVVSKQVFFCWSITDWEISHGHTCIRRAQVENH